MQVLLLAGGKGTRLRPITEHYPKCLVPIVGSPLLSYWLKPLQTLPISHIHINTHYLPDQIEAFVQEHELVKKISLHFEPTLKGTLKTFVDLLSTLSLHDDEDILVAHADNLIVCNWIEFLTYHQQNPKSSLGTVMTFIPDQPELCGLIEQDEQHTLLSIQHQQHQQQQQTATVKANGAVFLFKGAIRHYFKQAEQVAKQQQQLGDISLHLLPLLVGKIKCWHNGIYLRDIGNPTSYHLAQQEIVERLAQQMQGEND